MTDERYSNLENTSFSSGDYTALQQGQEQNLVYHYHEKINNSKPVTSNLLLKSLPHCELESLKPYLESIKLYQGEILYKCDDTIKYVYFPVTCIITMITLFNNGTSVESGIIGNEGILGAVTCLFNGGSHRDAYVQVTGQALRMKAGDFRYFIKQDSIFRNFVYAYIPTFIEQSLQIGACNSHHSLRLRLARLLLMCADRSERSQFHITQEFISLMVSAHRPNVSHAAIFLKDKKLIKYFRGGIVIIDREGLIKLSCECYEIINEIYKDYFFLLGV